MHSTLKQFFSIRELEKRTEDQLISFLDENWISSGYSSNREEHEWFSKSVAMLKKYYREFDCMTKPLMLETNFKSQIDNLTIEGKFDRIDRLSGKECEIIDYKLGQPEGMFIDGPEDDYQWVFYYLGATKHFGLNISKISYHYIQASKKISLSPDADLAKEKFKQIQSIVADINMSTTFVAKSNKYCPNCSLYKRCCKEFDGGK